MKKILFIFTLTLSLALYAEDTIPALSLDTIAVALPDSLQQDSIPLDAVPQDTVPQVVLITDVMSNVVVHQDSLVRQLLFEKASGVTAQPVDVAGYRVQIYSSNHQQTAKLEAMRLEKEMQEKLDIPVYVTYTPPFWKVRIGDFATYEEAQEFKNSFIREFPELLGDTYVVRDQVTLKR
ncbi:MAG: SPOR domain-containing protein [Paludibacteraceae bacterium]|nr:SPOR domain-containing protein [Paludibacteraceae bacterium]